MKYFYITIVWFFVLLIQWCSQIKTWVDSVIEKDRAFQEKNIPTSLTSKDLVERVNIWSWLLDLSWLDLPKVPNICELLPREYLSEIVAVDISDNNLTSVETNLDCLPFLKELNLSENKITEILWLWDLDSLVSLYLDSNNLSSLKNLPVLENLKELSLKYNKLKDLSWINLFKELVWLDIENNLLEDLVWIDQLRKLEKLKTWYNDLSSWAAWLLKQLKEAWVLQK